MKKYRKILPFVDQCVVSILSLVSSFLVLKYSGMDYFAAFQFLTIFLFFGVTLTNSSVIACEAKNISLSGVGRNCGAILVASLIIFCYCTILYFVSPQLDIISAVENISYFQVTFFAFFYLLQDALRRLLMVNDSEGVSLVSDIISYGGQVVLLVLAYNIWTKITFNQLMACMYVSSALACIPSVLRIVKDIGNIGAQFRAVWSESIKVSRTLTLSAIMKFLSNQSIFIYAGVLLGSEVFGGVKATQLLYKPFNLFLVAYESYLPKIFFQKDNFQQCMSLAKKLGVYIGALLVVYVLIINATFHYYPDLLPISELIVLPQSILWAFFYFLMSVSLLQRACLRVLAKDSSILISSSISLSLAASIWLFSEGLISNGLDVIIFSIFVCMGGLILEFYFKANFRKNGYV